MKRFLLPAFLLVGFLAAPAGAADWSGWWLPANYSKHGVAIDNLFYWIFGITMVTFVGVELVLVVFLIKYRARKDRPKAHFTHGNTRLEMAWTLAPAVILAVLALASKKVWDDFRYSADMNNPNAAKILVIGQQFKWNVIYPGKDGKFGRYLLFPKPSDIAWPHKRGDEKHFFQGVPGPASLPYDKAMEAINAFIAQGGVEFQLGKDLSDPDGIDDDYQQAQGRTLFLPVNRPVHIEISSRDVIHDFYLPNFRAQLYAVPGMRSEFCFTPTVTTRDLEAASRREYKIDELASLVGSTEYDVSIPPDTPGASQFRAGSLKYWHYTNPSDKKTIVRDAGTLSPEVVAKLKAAGIASVTAYRPARLEVACAQLCGASHYTMRADIVILSQDEYQEKFESGKMGDAGSESSVASTAK